MKWLKRATAAVVILAAIILLVILGTGWFIAPQDKLERVDAIVVVSGGDTDERTDEGVRLWRDNWAPKLIFAGAAADRGTSNAAVMRARAVGAGVPVESTIIEERSRNTKENAELLKPILEAQNIRRVIIVSSPYHTRRVKVTFERTYGDGYEFLVHPAKDGQWARKSWWQQPATVDLTIDELQKTIYSAFFQR